MLNQVAAEGLEPPTSGLWNQQAANCSTLRCAIHILHRQRIACMIILFQPKIYAKLHRITNPSSRTSCHQHKNETNFCGRVHTTSLCLIIYLPRPTIMINEKIQLLPFSYAGIVRTIQRYPWKIIDIYGKNVHFRTNCLPSQAGSVKSYLCLKKELQKGERERIRTTILSLHDLFWCGVWCRRCTCAIKLTSPWQWAW